MKGALADFKKDLTRIKGVADWLDTPDGLRPEMSDSTTAIRCGSVVLLSGYFETFLRECLSAFVREVNALKKPIDTLPLRIHYVHFERGSRSLYELVREERRDDVPPVKSVELANRLASTSLKIGYELAWEAFTQTQANPGVRVVKELLNDVAIEDPWKKLREALPTSVGDPTIWLTGFIAVRNECAHSGSTTAPPTSSELRQHCDNFELLGAAIVAVLGAQVAALSTL
jgi:hypothetical protein